MAEGTIDKLSIEISASSTKAKTSIERLADALRDLKYAMQAENGDTFDKLKKLSDALSSLKDASNIKLSNKLPDQLRNIGIAVSEVSDDTVRKLSEMTAAIDRLRGIDLKGFSSAVRAAKKASGEVTALSVVPKKEAGIAKFKPVSDKEITDMFDRDFGKGKSSSGLLDSMKQIGRELGSRIKPTMQAFGNMLKSAAGYASKIAKSFLSFAGKTIKNVWDKSAFKGLENSLARINKIISSFSRIAFYRAIRSAIKYVTDALKEGTENAYHYADEFGNATHYIAEAYDRLSSSNFKMSNQLGAAWATLIATIEPIIIQIINLVTKAADAITQLFALLSGKGTYLKAVDYNKKWADSAGGAAKAAKEWKNQLMSFDEINRLEEPSSPSGGGGSSTPTDYNNMFEETPVSKFFEDIKKAFESGEWAQIGKMMGEKANEIVNSIDWSALGTRFARGLQAVISIGYNFLKTVDFQNIGASISAFINSAIANIDFYEAGRLWMRLRTALWDVIYGAVISLDWSEVATALSNYILGALTELSEWLETLDPVKIAKALKDFFGNIRYKDIAEKLKEVLKKVFKLVGDVVGELLPEDLGDNVRDGIVNAIKEADFAVIHNVLSYQLDKAVFGEKWANFWWSRGDYAGKEIILGIISGNQSKTADLQKSMKDNIEDPTNDMMINVTNSIGDVNDAFGFMCWNGADAMAEMNNSVYQNGQNMVDNLGTIRNAAMEVWGWLNSLSDAGVARIEANGGIWNSLGGFATGGFPEDGLFMANHGELVGKFSNGRTAVANNEQITTGIADAVYEAFMTAFTQTGNGGSGQPVNIYLDGRQIAQTTTKYQTQFARAGGV